jgi:hypothetical protein
MADVVWVKYSTLERTSGQLERILSELEDAASLSGDLLGAIGRPYGRGELHDRVDSFESGWDNRRGDLVRDITKIREHVVGVLDGFREWDEETASQMDIDASGLSSASRPTPA